MFISSTYIAYIIIITINSFRRKGHVNTACYRTFVGCISQIVVSCSSITANLTWYENLRSCIALNPESNWLVFHPTYLDKEHGELHVASRIFDTIAIELEVILKAAIVGHCCWKQSSITKRFGCIFYHFTQMCGIYCSNTSRNAIAPPHSLNCSLVDGLVEDFKATCCCTISNSASWWLLTSYTTIPE